MGLLRGPRRSLLARKIRWLLRDEFTDTRAGGAVNGTGATPGPGARVVTDTGNNLSVAGGVAAIAGGAGAWGDPGLWYAGVSRVAGRLILINLTYGAFVIGSFEGWSQDQIGEPVVGADVIYPRLAILLRVRANNVVIGAASEVTLATQYIYAVILRAAGAYYYVRGGGFVDWTLIWVASAGNLATVYPAIVSQSDVFDVDYVRVPDELYLPTPLAYDSFTRANGALGSTEATGPDGQTAPVQTWNNRVGTTLVAGNVASASALVGGIAIATVDTAASPDTIVQSTLTRAGNEVGVILRYVDADNYIRAVHDGTNCQLIKRIATAETTVITAAVAIGAGQIVVIPDGTEFALYLNNVQVGATSTINDAALQTGTEQGLFSTNVGNTQDIFLVMPRGTGGEYNRLERWSA